MRVCARARLIASRPAYVMVRKVLLALMVVVMCQGKGRSLSATYCYYFFMKSNIRPEAPQPALFHSDSASFVPLD